jgi:hypothetical protein
MRLFKRLIELAFVVFIISVFMKNSDISVNLKYYGLKDPINVAFWELVTLCVSMGIIISALGDFVTQLRWIRERSQLKKVSKEHAAAVEDYNRRIEELEKENMTLRAEAEKGSNPPETLREHDIAGLGADKSGRATD